MYFLTVNYYLLSIVTFLAKIFQFFTIELCYFLYGAITTPFAYVSESCMSLRLDSSITEFCTSAQSTGLILSYTVALAGLLVALNQFWLVPFVFASRTDDCSRNQRRFSANLARLEGFEPKC